MATSTASLDVDLGPVREQLSNIAYEAAEAAFKAVSKRKHAFAAYQDVSGLAAYLGCSTSYVYLLEKKGLPVSMIDGHRMYSVTRVDAWMQAHEV